MKILNGKLLARLILEQLKGEAKKIIPPPGLQIIWVGNDKLSGEFIREKEKQAKVLSIDVKIERLDSNIKQQDLIGLIKQFNNNKRLDGIVVQLPLPSRINVKKIVWSIIPEKDVDGFRMQNFLPPAPSGIIRLLGHYNIPLTASRILIVGEGLLVGKPLALMLKKLGAQVATISVVNREQLVEKMAWAQIIVIATGAKNSVPKELFLPNHIVVLAGANHKEGASEVDYKAIKGQVKAITPPIGGVGPMTVAMLLANTVKSARHNRENPQ